MPVSDTKSPGHNAVSPNGVIIAVGAGLTAITLVVIHVVGSVYVIVTFPVVTPVTTPVVRSTVPFAGVLLLHVPPVGVELNVIVVPGHTEEGPVIAAGSGFTVNSLIL